MKKVKVRKTVCGEVLTFLSWKDFSFEHKHINKLYIISKCIEVYVYVGVLSLGQAKLVNCSQIWGHVVDQNYIAIIDSDSLLAVLI